MYMNMINKLITSISFCNIYNGLRVSSLRNNQIKMLLFKQMSNFIVMSLEYSNVLTS